MSRATLHHFPSLMYVADTDKYTNVSSADDGFYSDGRYALQYIMLHLLGYKLSMDYLKSFRQFHSLTPGHPEANHAAGVSLSACVKLVS